MVKVRTAARRRFRHEGHDRRRVETAGEKGPERHVGHEPALHRRAQEIAKQLLGLVVRRDTAPSRKRTDQ